MQADPLQQLRDVHSPLEPVWWPPAPGWWFLLLICTALVTWLIWYGWRAWRHRAPVREAKRLHKQYVQELASGSLSSVEFVDRCNELLKRVLVRSYAQYQFAPLSGRAWLQALDELSNSRDFTDGPGQALGNERFTAHPEIDAEALSPLIVSALNSAVRA